MSPSEELVTLDLSSQFFHIISSQYLKNLTHKQNESSVCQYMDVFGRMILIGMRDQLGRLLPRDFHSFIFSFYCISNPSSFHFQFYFLHLSFQILVLSDRFLVMNGFQNYYIERLGQSLEKQAGRYICVYTCFLILYQFHKKIFSF